MKNRAARIAAIVFALLLLSTWLYRGTGVDENREIAAVPTITLGVLYNGSVFPQVDAALIDRYGPKSAAVGLVGQSILALGLSPSRQVVRGTDGTLFYAGDFWIPCQPAQDLVAIDFAGQLDAFAADLANKGTTLLYAVVPNKSSVGSERLGLLQQPLTACSAPNRDYIAAMAGDTMLSAWPEFETAYDDGAQLFLPADTHWNTPGAVLFSTMLLEKLVAIDAAPADLVVDPLVAGEPYEHKGDLSRYVGVNGSDEVTPLLPLRDTTTVASSSTTADGIPLLHWTSTGAAPVVAGRTLIVRDSLFDTNAALLAPYFADLTAVAGQDVRTAGDLAALGHFDLVIIQQFERSVPQNLVQLRASGLD